MKKMHLFVWRTLAMLLMVLATTINTSAMTRDATTPSDINDWLSVYLDHLKHERMLELLAFSHPEDRRQARILFEQLFERAGADRAGTVEAIFGKPLSAEQLAALPDEAYLRAALSMGMMSVDGLDSGLSSMQFAVADIKERDSSARVSVAVWDPDDGGPDAAVAMTVNLVRVDGHWYLRQRMTPEKVAGFLRGFDLRAQVGQVFTAVAGVKMSLARFAETNGRYPNADELEDPSFSVDAAVEACGLCDVMLDADTGTIYTMLTDSAMPEIRGRQIHFTPTPLPPRTPNEKFGFRCQSDIAQNYLPRSCRSIESGP